MFPTLTHLPRNLNLYDPITLSVVFIFNKPRMQTKIYTLFCCSLHNSFSTLNPFKHPHHEPDKTAFPKIRSIFHRFCLCKSFPLLALVAHLHNSTKWHLVIYWVKPTKTPNLHFVYRIKREILFCVGNVLGNFDIS